MRAAVQFAEDTAEAVEAVRRELGVGVSEAVNELMGGGLVSRPDEPRFKQRTRRLGIQVDVSNIASTLEDLEGSQAR